nr:thermonuclease family protein [Pseudomonas sp. GM_Psu_2]
MCGRRVAPAYQDNTDVNAEQVRQVAAWVYRQYLKDRSLLDLKAQAKAQKRGLRRSKYHRGSGATPRVISVKTRKLERASRRRQYRRSDRHPSLNLANRRAPAPRDPSAAHR